jgi:hypothetical protein
MFSQQAMAAIVAGSRPPYRQSDNVAVLVVNFCINKLIWNQTKDFFTAFGYTIINRFLVFFAALQKKITGLFP